ncbi:MAG: substrate-binding domain-containing protein [Flavimaricola sp.]|nr:substrate-binding domain-containing protein [Flavimaricola sp.]
MTIVGLGPHGEPAAAPERVTLLPQDIAAARARHLRVAVVMHTVQSDWAKHLIQGIVAVLGDCGAIVIETVDCDFSPDLQIAALDRLRGERLDAIISLPVDNAVVAEAHKRVSAAGIKLVLVDNAPTGLLPGKDYVSLISADNFGLGKMAAELLARQLPENAKAGLIGFDADFFATNERELAFARWMEINRPDVQLTTTRFSAVASAGTATEKLLDQHPDLQGLFVVWDTPCDEVLAVMANRQITIPVTTVDLGHNVSVSLASGGPVIGISAQQPLLQGQAVARTTITTLLGRGCPEWVALPGIAVTRETVAESYQTIWRTPAPREILRGLDLLT